MPFPCFTEQQDSEEPFFQGKVRVVKDRAGRDTELVVTRLAIEELLCCGGFPRWRLCNAYIQRHSASGAGQAIHGIIHHIKQIDNVN